MESISAFLKLPVGTEKPLSDQQKKWILQREIFALLEKENIKLLNWKRYIAYLKKYRISERSIGRSTALKQWRKIKDKEVSEVKRLTKSSFGFFTNHIKFDDLFALKSKTQDMLNRGESPTCYVYSLNKIEK